MTNFFNDVLLFIYMSLYHILDGINSLFFPDGWIKFITIPLVILSLTYYFITSYELDKEESYLTQLFQTFMMVFALYFEIAGWSLSMKELALGAFDRKKIAVELENPLTKKEITIDGELQNNAIKLINCFTNIRDTSHQGSYYWGEKINIEIKVDKNILKFQLQEDNKLLNNYWVFYFREEQNKYEYIGHIKTDYAGLIVDGVEE